MAGIGHGSLSLCLLRVGEFSVGLNSINGNLHDGCGVHRRSTFLSTGPLRDSDPKMGMVPHPTKKSLAGCSLLFFRLVNVTSISRLLDTVLQRYRSGRCCSNFPS